MKKPTLFNRNTNAIALSLLLLTSPQTVFAEDTPSSIQTVVLEDGTSIGIIIVNSPSPTPQQKLADIVLAKSAVAKIVVGKDVKISGVPAFTWSYGSSNTAGAMIAGYYDRVGFPNMYAGPTNGGCMPLTNASWGNNECPLSATKMGLDGRTTRGHVDDYFVSDLSKGPDPYVMKSLVEHTIGQCTGDYMKTSKWFPGSASIVGTDINQDGSAFFGLDITGERMTASMLVALNIDQYDAGYGLKLFFESRGYKVATMYNQYIAPFKAAGFTYLQYKAEIDAGRPVMLHLSSHDVVGIGYNGTTNEIIFHDPSRNPIEQRMTWGGTYNTVYTHNAVTVVTLTDAISPSTRCGKKFPWTMFLPAITRSR